MSRELPIHAVREALEARMKDGPVVVSSPTGSGKSTEVPRWAARAYGRVLVVEPRRVACRSLAARVAELEGTTLGDGVGYVVRDESVATASTRIVFATPGIVLANRSFVDAFDVLVLDELHERSLDLDLLLALFRGASRPRLIVMSATLDATRVAAYLDGAHVEASGRAYDVAIHYAEAGPTLPSAIDLVPRVVRAVAASADYPGDVLVFLPGKGEIDACHRAVGDAGFDVIPLHGGLTLDVQRRAFAPSSRRKLVLATNVAETSITLPGVGVVIDTGLVRRTRYHEGRGFLSLVPIAEDSATQRAGRAGRTGPGVCLRLWGKGARLDTLTPPEIHRESLVPMMLAAAAWQTRLDTLPLFDPPKPYAVTAARDELVHLGAIDASDALTPLGVALRGLPIDAPLARLLVEARRTDCLEDAIDLVSALAIGKPLFLRDAPMGEGLREGNCDATALIRLVRLRGHADGVAFSTLEEARRVRARLRRAHDLPERSERTDIDREGLIRTAIAADPRCAHVSRVRGRSVAYSNGGTERELARESLVGSGTKVPDAIVVFESRAFGQGQDMRVLVTCASPTTFTTLARAGLGRDVIESVHLERSRIVSTLARTYAKKVIATREDVPTGELARDAIATLFLRGSLWKDASKESAARITLSALAVSLGHAAELDPAMREAPTLDAFVRMRLETLGIEHADDLALLSPSDLLAPDVPFHIKSGLERDYPRTLALGDATYEVTYDLEARRVTLTLVRGRPEPPKLNYLPPFKGFGIVVSTPRGMTVLRARG